MVITGGNYFNILYFVVTCIRRVGVDVIYRKDRESAEAMFKMYSDSFPKAEITLTTEEKNFKKKKDMGQW